MLSSFMLFLALADREKQSKLIIIVGIATVTFIISGLLIETQFNLMLLQSMAALLFYALIFALGIKSMRELNNIGYSIIYAAVFIVFITSLVQIYALLVLKHISLAYGLAFSASIVGFVLVGIGYLTSILVSEHKQLSILALKDPLTGMNNRRGLDHLLQAIIPAAKRYEKYLALITIDIDFFKEVNDTYGHDGGDTVLKEFATMLQNASRSSDISCRLGGEEFLIVLPETDLPKALVLAEKLRDKVETLRINYKDQTIQLTASFGVAVGYNGDLDIDSILKDADKALYAAKNAGRNRVCHTEPETS